MPFIEWNESMLLGVETIDGEHVALINHLNELYAAFERNEGQDILGRTLDNIRAFTIEHFRHEEALFGATPYAHLYGEKHRIEHAEIIGRIKEFQDKFRFGPSDALMVELMVYLKNFVKHHICGTDLEYVPYIKGKAQ